MSKRLSAERKKSLWFFFYFIEWNNEIFRRQNERFSNAKTDLKLLGFRSGGACVEVSPRNRWSFLNQHIDCAQRGWWMSICDERRESAVNRYSIEGNKTREWRKNETSKTNKQTRIRRRIRWDRDERVCGACVWWENENTYACGCLRGLDEMYSENEEGGRRGTSISLLIVVVFSPNGNDLWRTLFQRRRFSETTNQPTNQTKHTSMKRKHCCFYEANQEKLEKSTRACITIRRFIIFLFSFAWRYECCYCCCYSCW